MRDYSTLKTELIPDLIKSSIPTPFYVVDEELLIRNLEILKNTAKRAGCKILLAQKAFSMFAIYPLISKYLDGTTASGLYEAKLGHDEFGGETHIFSAAYSEREFEEISHICGHVIFNSVAQWKKYRDIALSNGCECGLRINPEHSTQEGHAIYDPCSFGSRLGITYDNLKKAGDDILNGISGLHFHTLCEQNSDALEETVMAFEEKFGSYLYNMKWLNLGGGHHITRADYDIERLISVITRLKQKYGVEIYLEPGEAVVLNTGFLVSEVLDVTENGITNAIIDASAACHMPDVLEMPYRPEIIKDGKYAEEPEILPYTVRIGSATCLAGDVIGDYSFEKPLKIGDKLVFCDMALYSMVKNNTFNGMKLPSIAVRRLSRDVELIKEFGYDDFKMRLS